MAELSELNSWKSAADVLHRLHRRGVGRTHRHGVGFADLFQLRHEHVQSDGEPEPEQQHRYGNQAQHVREPRLRERVVVEFLRELGVCGTHGNVISQKVCAFTRRNLRALTMAPVFLILVVAVFKA